MKQEYASTLKNITLDFPPSKPAVGVSGYTKLNASQMVHLKDTYIRREEGGK